MCFLWHTCWNTGQWWIGISSQPWYWPRGRLQPSSKRGPCRFIILIIWGSSGAALPSDCLTKGKCTSNAQLKWILIGLAVADVGCILLRRLMVHLSKPSLQYLSLFDPLWPALNIIPRSGQVTISELNITQGNFKVNPAAASVCHVLS